MSALLAAEEATPGLIILITAPTSAPLTGRTSVTEAWRSSLYHVTVVASWGWNATEAEKRAGYDRASASIDRLRRITPDAAYIVSICVLDNWYFSDSLFLQNEADVYEPNHEIAFWGTHYSELWSIKQK